MMQEPSRGRCTSVSGERIKNISWVTGLHDHSFAVTGSRASTEYNTQDIFMRL